LETRQTLFVNNRLTHLFGYTLDDIRALGQDYFTQLLHPEDLSKLETWRKQAGELAEGKARDRISLLAQRHLLEMGSGQRNRF
jgi:PAS domain-containing protein